MTPEATLPDSALDIARPLLVFSGGANEALTRDICKHLNVEMGKADVRRFSDSETFVKINENVRGEEVFVVQPTCSPANEHIMSLLLMIDALRRASASQICAVIPYFGYARQDRKEQGRVALSAKLVANLIVEAGAHRVLTIELHTARSRASSTSPWTISSRFLCWPRTSSAPAT